VISVIQIHLVGGVNYPVLLLQACPAAEGNAAAAENGMAADIDIGLYHDDAGTGAGSTYRGGQASGTGPDHHHVRGKAGV
jgi:hypothetical protein